MHSDIIISKDAVPGMRVTVLLSRFRLLHAIVHVTAIRLREWTFCRRGARRDIRVSIVLRSKRDFRASNSLNSDSVRVALDFCRKNKFFCILLSCRYSN